MSQPAFRRHDYDDLQAAELARWPGVTWTRQFRAKHMSLVLTFQGETRFVTYPTSPGDNYRGGLNHLRDVRLVLTSMGAKRTEEVKSTQPRRRRNRTEPARVVIADRATGGPKRDPWAALAQWTPPVAAEVAPAPEAPLLPFWQRVLAWVGRGK